MHIWNVCDCVSLWVMLMSAKTCGDVNNSNKLTYIIWVFCIDCEWEKIIALTLGL